MIPPRPNRRAPAPSSNRRARSSNTGATSASVAANPAANAALLFGTGYGAWLSLAPAILAARTDPRHIGRALGTHATAVGIGGMIGPVLASPVLAHAPALTLGGCAAVAVISALVLGAAR